MPPSPPPALEQALDLAREHHELYLTALTYEDSLDSRLKDILAKYATSPSLTSGQAAWLAREIDSLKDITPLYGNFKAIEIMFMLAGENLKAPKIRLMTKDDIFVQLNFMPAREEKEEFNMYTGKMETKPAMPRHIKVFRDGWQGHGRRASVGQILDGVFHPDRYGNHTDSIIVLLQEFSLDPAAVAKAAANKLGACSFCATRLSDPESKARGYGPICAGHYGLPWGERDEAAIAYETKVAQLDASALL